MKNHYFKTREIAFQIFVGLIFVLILNGCTQKSEPTFEEKANSSISQYFANKIDDPKSFEFVEITDVDTITYKEHLEREISIFSIFLQNKESRLQQADELENSARQLLKFRPSDSDAKKGLENAEMIRTGIKNYQVKVDSLTELLSSPNGDKIEFIEMKYKFRMNNSDGIKNLFSYYVRLNEDLSVKSVSEEKEEN